MTSGAVWWTKEIGGNEDKFWVGLDRKWSKWRQIWGLLVCLNRKWSKWRQIWGLVESRPMISCSSDIASGPGDSASVVVSPSRALYVWLCIWGAFYMCGALYRCVWYVVGLYGQACQQCGPLANHRLAHQDWSHGPHICNILRPYHLGHMPHVISKHLKGQLCPRVSNVFPLFLPCPPPLFQSLSFVATKGLIFIQPLF